MRKDKEIMSTKLDNESSREFVNNGSFYADSQINGNQMKVVSNRRYGFKTLIPILFIVALFLISTITGYTISALSARGEVNGDIVTDFDTKSSISNLNIFWDTETDHKYVGYSSGDSVVRNSTPLSASSRDTYKLSLNNDNTNITRAWLELKLTFYKTTVISFSDYSGLTFQAQSGGAEPPKFTLYDDGNTNEINTIITFRTDMAVANSNYIYLDNFFAQLSVALRRTVLNDIRFLIEVTPYEDSGFQNSFRKFYIDGNLSAKPIIESGSSSVITLNNGVDSAGQLTITVDGTMPNITPPTKEGYAFGGYYSGEDGTGTQYYNSEGVFCAGDWRPTENSIFYAKWTANVSIVTYHTNGGVFVLGFTPTEYCNYEDTLTLPTDAQITKGAYTFAGWFTDSALTGVAVTEISGTGSEINLYAKWLAKSIITLTFSRSPDSLTCGLFDGTSNASATSNVTINDPVLIEGTTYKVVIESNEASTGSGEYYNNWYPKGTGSNNPFFGGAERTFLTSVDFSKFLGPQIGYCAFYGCNNLTTIDLGEKITKIGEAAFKYATRLKEVTIPKSVETLLGSAFAYCSALTSLNFEQDSELETLGGAAFRDCTQLESVKIPYGVTVIDDIAFYNNTSLTSVSIPNTVTTIGSQAFKSCTALTTITIPSSISNSASIEANAFNICSALTTVYIESSTVANGLTSTTAQGGLLGNANLTTIYVWVNVNNPPSPPTISGFTIQTTNDEPDIYTPSGGSKGYYMYKKIVP